MKRGYTKAYNQRTGVVTCPHCGGLVFPRYEVMSGTGVGPNGGLAPRRKKGAVADSPSPKKSYPPTVPLPATSGGDAS